jgi:hypothetical protein
MGVRDFGIEIEANPIAKFFIRHKVPWVLTVIMIIVLMAFYVITLPMSEDLVFHVAIFMVVLYFLVFVNDTVMLIRCKAEQE